MRHLPSATQPSPVVAARTGVAPRAKSDGAQLGQEIRRAARAAQNFMKDVIREAEMCLPPGIEEWRLVSTNLSSDPRSAASGPVASLERKSHKAVSPVTEPLFRCYSLTFDVSGLVRSLYQVLVQRRIRAWAPIKSRLRAGATPRNHAPRPSEGNSRHLSMPICWSSVSRRPKPTYGVTFASLHLQSIRCRPRSNVSSARP